MKRPEGFDERPAQPDASAGDAQAPRQRRAPLIPRRPSRDPRQDVQEAQPDPAPQDAVDEPVASTTPEEPGTSARDRAGAFAGAAGRRLGAGLGAGFSTVKDRLREYTPDEDHPESRPASEATVDDLHVDADQHHDDHEAPIGAGVRAAETAREARVAKRRRRLLERAEVRRFTRRSRHRRAAWITAASIVLVFGVSILVAVFSPLMALQTIEIKGTNRVDETQLRQALSDQIGTPLARLDFDAIKKDIAGFPLIESYVTEEAPPHTLVVTVTERTPVVAVQSGKSFDLVDPAGIVVQSSPKQPANMPVADVGNAKLGSSVFRTMTEVVLALPSTVRQQVTSVKASTADDVTLTLKDGSSVVWGNPEQSDAKAALLAALVKDHAARNPGVVVEYDVSAPDNGIIRAKK
ncbi:FtsQ-type POTRA domain-containing protein [Curtobacterium pusillum]|uniref:FtsQ-type POTRA domain-containing protein n=1 Tax=Curtobacterium pusillum TaxID=69373 RepID=UPI0038181DEB